jgi:hypothetical protein
VFEIGSGSGQPRFVTEWTGFRLPPPVTIQSGEALIQFETDASVNADGFRLEYSALRGYLPPALSSSPASQVPTTPRPTIPPTSAGGCSGVLTLTARTGELASSYNMPTYKPMSRCEWLILATGSISLTFLDFDLVSKLALLPACLSTELGSGRSTLT